MTATATRTVTVTVVAAVLLLGATGTVAAQETSSPTPTPSNNTTTDSDPWQTPESTDTPDATPTLDGDNSSESAVNDGGKTLSRYTVITDWEYSGGQWTITFNAREPVTVTMSQAGQAEEGATTFTIERFELDRGVNTVTFKSAALNDEAQVSITSQYSIEEGRGVLLSTGQSGGSNPFNTPGTMGWFGGAAVVFSMGLYVFRKRLRGGKGSPSSAWGGR